MPGFLKQATASQSRAIGPFVDDTDFKTPETALSIANTDIKLVVNGGASANKNSGGGTHRANGVYGVTFDATDTATVGELEVSVVVAGALPVFDKFVVLEEAIYDALIAAAATGFDANGRVDVGEWLGTAVATPTVAGVPEVDITHFNGVAGTFAAGRPEVNTTHVAGTAQTAGDIIADTNDIQARLPAALVSGRIDASVGAMAAGVVTAAAVATGAIDADALASDAVTEIRAVASGTSDSGTTTTMVDAARTEADTDYWKGLWILFTSGTIAGQVRQITGFNAATDTITFSPATTQAVGTQTYEILPAGAVDVRLWNGSAPSNLISGRVDANAQVVGTGAIVAGSFAAGAIDASAVAADAIGASELAADAVTEIANAVWDMDATGHQTQGTFGQAIGDPVADTNTIYKAVVTDATGATVGVDVVSIQADTDNIQTRLPAALISGRMDSNAQVVGTAAISSTSFAAGAIDSAAIAADAIGSSELAASAIDEILDEQIGDGTITMREALRVIMASVAAKLSGAATTTITIRNVADTADVITATVDANGNRTAVTVTP